jgi:hypothetical protein
LSAFIGGEIRKGGKRKRGNCEREKKKGERKRENLK